MVSTGCDGGRSGRPRFPTVSPRANYAVHTPRGVLGREKKLIPPGKDMPPGDMPPGDMPPGSVPPDGVPPGGVIPDGQLPLPTPGTPTGQQTPEVPLPIDNTLPFETYAWPKSQLVGARTVFFVPSDGSAAFTRNLNNRYLGARRTPSPGVGRFDIETEKRENAYRGRDDERWIYRNQQQPEDRDSDQHEIPSEKDKSEPSDKTSGERGSSEKAKPPNRPLVRGVPE